MVLHLKVLKVVRVYAFTVLVIILPLLLLGYIQTTDMPWGPHIPLTDHNSNYYLLFVLIHGLSSILSSMVVQKFMLFSVFLLAAGGAHWLALLSPRLEVHSSVAFTAGLLYIFNPFFYTRLMQGQWLVLLGYALLPWAIGSFWKLMQTPTKKQAVIAAGWTIAVGLTSIHAVGFVLLAHFVLFIAAGRQNIKKRFLLVTAASVAWLVANSLWLFPIFTGHSKTATAINNFGPAQLQAYATVGTVHGSVPLSTLLLEGFWADPQGRYVIPSHQGALWFVVAGLIGVLIVLGVIYAIRRRDRLGISLLVLAVIAWWLSMGIAWGPSAGTTNFLISHVPFYRGYREPQKWLMLLTLAYAYFAASGTAYLLERCRGKLASSQPYVAFTAALLPIMLMPILLFGAGGQLKSSQYPADWYTVAGILNERNGNAPVLILPWHQYIRLKFVGRVVANPASHFFKQPVVTGDISELRGLPAEGTSPLEIFVNKQLLPQRNIRTDAGAELKQYGVKYIVLYKESDWDTYNWLNQQKNLNMVYDGPHIRLYAVE